jgi:hypothetical protein
VPEEMARRIDATGYSVSNVIQISLEMFLNLTPEQQKALIDEHIKNKKLERVRERFPELESE